MKILKNAARCRLCGDIIESVTRHDFKSCSCGAVMVDGGKEYIRRCFKDRDDCVELSEYETDEMHDYLGKPIKVGDIVVKAKFHSKAAICLARVSRLCEKKVKLIPLKRNLEPINPNLGETQRMTSFPDALLVINDLLEKTHE